MVVAQATIIGFLGIAFIFFWIAFQLENEKHDILKGLLLVTGLIMCVLTLSVSQHFIEADAVVNGYSGDPSYDKIIDNVVTAFKAFTYLIYVILTYVVIYYVFFVIAPKTMDWAMNIGLVKRKRKREDDND